ncbi:ABC transporter permease subunit [Streptosporangium sp. NPDC001682]
MSRSSGRPCPPTCARSRRPGTGSSPGRRGACPRCRYRSPGARRPAAVFGRHIYAIGGNLNAASLSGIKVKSVTFWIFVNMGVLAALAGIIFAGRLNQAGPTAGNGFELDAIAAAFIGGAAVQGGVGKVVGALTGGLIMAVINNGMSLIGAPSERVMLFKGLVLLAAVALDVWTKRRAGSAR